MKVPPFTRVAGVTPVHDFLKEIGAPADRIAKRAGLSTERFDDPDALVPFHPASAYFGAAARASGIPNLGALASFAMPDPSIGSLGTAFRASSTLYDMMLAARQLTPIFCSAIQVWFREDGDRIWFCERYSGIDEDGNAQVDSFLLANIVDSVRAVVGSDWRPECIRVPLRARAAIRGVDAWAATRIDFTRDVLAVAIPRKLLPATVPFVEQRRSDAAAAGLLRSAPPQDYQGAMSAVIRSMAADGPASVKRVAAAVGTSVRSMQRHLAESQVTFSDLVAETRVTLARDLLQDPAVKTIDVAFELGYSDPANFTRAFRRWTGVSPREYRRSVVGTVA